MILATIFLISIIIILLLISDNVNLNRKITSMNKGKGILASKKDKQSLGNIVETVKQYKEKEEKEKIPDNTLELLLKFLKKKE